MEIFINKLSLQMSTEKWKHISYLTKYTLPLQMTKEQNALRRLQLQNSHMHLAY